MREKYRRATMLLETIEQDVMRFQSDASLSVNLAVGLEESESVSDVGSRKINAPVSVAASYDEFEDHVEITWEDVSEVEQGFYIYRDCAKIDSVSAGRTSYGDYQGQPGVEQTYSVSEFGESDQSSDTGFRKLETPTLIDASDGQAETEIKITWVDNSRAESGYEIARNGVVIDTTLANTTAYIDSSGIDFGMAYEYRIAAVDPYGRSKAESDSGFTTVLPPSDVNASTTYEDRITVVWVDASEIEAGYRLTRRKITQDVLDMDLTLPANTTSYIDTIASENLGEEFLYCLTAFSEGSG